MMPLYLFCLFFFFYDPATTEIYTLSLHDALPICGIADSGSVMRPGFWTTMAVVVPRRARILGRPCAIFGPWSYLGRSEEHTSELQSRRDLVCRLLLEKKKKRPNTSARTT